MILVGQERDLLSSGSRTLLYESENKETQTSIIAQTPHTRTSMFHPDIAAPERDHSSWAGNAPSEADPSLVRGHLESKPRLLY